NIVLDWPSDHGTSGDPGNAKSLLRMEVPSDCNTEEQALFIIPSQVSGLLCLQAALSHSATSQTGMSPAVQSFWVTLRQAAISGHRPQQFTHRCDWKASLTVELS